MPRGGSRPGAGAPRGNTNAMKSGRYSPRMTGLLRELAQNRAFVWFVTTLRDMDLSDDEFKDLFRRATSGLPETPRYAAAARRAARRKTREFKRRWRARGARPTTGVGRALFSVERDVLAAFRERLLAGPEALMQEAVEMHAHDRRNDAVHEALPPPRPLPNGPEDEPEPRIDVVLPEPDRSPRRRSRAHVLKALREGFRSPSAGAPPPPAPVSPRDPEPIIRSGETPRRWHAWASGPDDDFIAMPDSRIDDILKYDDIDQFAPIHPLTGVPVYRDRDDPDSWERSLARIRKDLRRYQKNRERMLARALGAHLRDHPDDPAANDPAIRKALR